MRRTLLTSISALAIAALCVVRVSASSDEGRVHQTGTVDAYPNYRIATIMVTFDDHPVKPTVDGTSTPLTQSYLDGLVFSNADSVAAFYSTVSGSRVTVAGDVYDNGGQWYEIPRPATLGGTCDWSTYFSDALTTADPDIDYSAYNTILIIAPQLSCSTGGRASIATIPNMGGTRYRIIEADGDVNYTVHHELGHVIGMDHANVWTCDPPGVLTGTNCVLEEYGDRFSVMGLSRARMITPAAPHMENLGWVEPGDIQEVTADGDYTIRPVELQGTGPRYLKVPQVTDATGAVTSWYYLEYRQAIGFDDIARTPTIQELGVTTGALVHVGTSASSYITTTLLDMTPGSLPGRDMFDPALPLGSSYTDAAAGVSFGVLARSSSTMTIRVKFGGASLCERKKPTVTAAAVRSKAKRSGEVRYRVSVKNNDVLCGQQTFTVRTSKKEKGWTAKIDKKTTSSAAILPGQKKNFDLRVKVPSNAKLGRHSLTVEARQKSYATLKKFVTVKPTVVLR